MFKVSHEDFVFVKEINEKSIILKINGSELELSKVFR